MYSLIAASYLNFYFECYVSGSRAVYNIDDMEKSILTKSFLDLRSKLHRIALRFLHNDEDAQDAMSDTFEKLWSKGKIESDQEARYKLIHALRNTCIDHLRKHHTISIESVKAEADREYELQTENMEVYEALLLKGLSTRQIEIYNLITHGCLEYEEVATQLDMKVEAVRMNMSRIRKQIRQNIKTMEL